MTRPTIPREELEEIGKAIYGDRWVTPLARDMRALFGWPDDRTAQRWASGKNPAPAKVRGQLIELMAAKTQENIAQNARLREMSTKLEEKIAEEG